jgi:hypothetical protein
MSGIVIGLALVCIWGVRAGALLVGLAILGTILLVLTGCTTRTTHTRPPPYRHFASARQENGRVVLWCEQRT